MLDEKNSNNISLDVDQKGFTIKASGFSESFLLDLVSKLKGEKIEANVVSVSPIKRPVGSITGLKGIPGITRLHDEPEVTEIPVVPTNPPINSVSAKFGDISKALYESAGVVPQENDTDFHHTGIKIKNNKPHYRCGYSCPKCGESGRHYIPNTVKAVNCHQCQAPLVVEASTDKGFGETDEHRDEHGNFFFAEVIDYTKMQGRRP